MGIISFSEFMEWLPLWSIYPVTLALAMLAIEAGFLLGKRWQRRSHVSKEGAVGDMTGSTLGLLVVEIEGQWPWKRMQTTEGFDN